MTEQRELDFTAPIHFDGKTYEPDKDQGRLSAQIGRVFRVMRDGTWRTLEEIATLTGDASVASISARLRDLRKPRFGAHTVERRRRGQAEKGLFEYKLTLNTDPPQDNA